MKYLSKEEVARLVKSGSMAFPLGDGGHARAPIGKSGVRPGRETLKMSYVRETLRSRYPVRVREEIWDWAHREVDFGTAKSFRGRYDVNNLPWTREILRAFRDPFVREETVLMPPQEGGKTTAAEVCLAWRIDQAPAPMAFNSVTNVKAKRWSETRWEQLQTYCPKLSERFSSNKNKKKKELVIFKDGTFLLIQGAEVPANRQSDSVEVQINDELQLWDTPWHGQMKTRTRAYRATRKILNLGLGSNVGSELHAAFVEGNQLEWCHHCPHCGRPFEYVFQYKHPKNNVRFDLNTVVTHPDGRLDLTEFAKTIYTFCTWEHCSEKILYDFDLWKKMNASGKYVARNPGADPQLVSIHVNSFALGLRPWSEILTPWVRLNLRGGIFNTEVLRDFITQELLEFWEDRPIVVNQEIRLGEYTSADVRRPPVFDAEKKCVSGWKDEYIRLMACDNQRGAKGDIPHRWYVVRAFARDGRSRQVYCGRINEWPALKAKAVELGVPEWTIQRPGPWVVCDRRYDPVDVDDQCAAFKWYGTLGAEQEEFVHNEKGSPFEGKRMQFSEDRAIDVGYGTQKQGRRHAMYFLWSTQKVQDYLAALRGGKAEAWELPADLGTFCPEYVEHINSHRQQIQEWGKTKQEIRVWYKLSGWEDHLYDCESQLVVLAIRAGVFKRE